LTFVENKAIVTGFYNNDNNNQVLQIGDIIKEINHIPVDSIIKEQLKYSPASNYPTQLRNIATNILRTNDSTIHIIYSHNNIIDSCNLEAYYLKEHRISSKFQPKDSCFKLIHDNIAYIDNGSLKKKYLPIIWEEINNAKGLIIDLRNYPTDFPIYSLSNYLMPNKTSFVKFSKGSIDSPGLFTMNNTLEAGRKNKKYYKQRVVIIVNEITQSSSEFHAMAYKVNPNSIIIGSTTAGADGNISDIILPGNIQTSISGIGVYYPNGNETQRIGIVPDIEVKPTVQGIIEGKDEVLDKAIEIINSKKGL
jgi:hypothetical protein